MASTVCLTFDFDALSVWLAYDDPSPSVLWRGEYGARVGVPRVLAFLEREGVPATFFVPGHTIESFPADTEAILAAGHEIGHHSWAHVAASEQTPDEERADFERALATLDGIGVKPEGFRGPDAELSAVTLELLEEHGFRYDTTLMADDYRPFRPRIGDRVSRQEPLERGREARVWEFPMALELDDWPHFQANFSPYRRGLSPPSRVLEIWQGEFDWMHEREGGGVLTVCMHPQVIGRGHRVAMLEKFVGHVRAAGGTFERIGDVAKSLPDPD